MKCIIIMLAAQLGVSMLQGAATTSADSAVASSAKYKLNLSPAWKVGQKFTYVADSSDKARTITLASDTPLNVEINILCHVEGKGEVLAVGKNGAISKLSLTVSAMSASINDKPVVNRPSTEAKPQPAWILAPGAVVVVERNDAGVEIFTVDGKPIIGPTMMKKSPTSPAMGGDGQPTYLGSDRYLKMLMDLDSFPGTDQDIFGAKDEVAIGDSWPSTAEARVKLLEVFGGAAYRHMAPPNVDGIDSRKIVFPATTAMMKLESVTGNEDDQRVAVSGNLSFTDLTVPIPPNPLGNAPSPPTSMDIQDKFNVFCPVSTTKGVLTRSSTLTIKQYPTTYEPPTPTYTGFKADMELSCTQQYTFQ